MATDGFEFDPYSMDVQENPYPYYAVLRKDHPLYWSEKANCWAPTTRSTSRASRSARSGWR